MSMVGIEMFLINWKVSILCIFYLKLENNVCDCEIFFRVENNVFCRYFNVVVDEFGVIFVCLIIV